MKLAVVQVRNMTYKGKRLVHAVHNSAISAGVKSRLVDKYTPCDVMVIYGFGGKTRHAIGLRHMDAGGLLIALDIGYWERRLGDTRKWRVAINGFHSPEYIMQGKYPGAARWQESGLLIKEKGGTGNKILLVGNSPKSNRVGASGWSVKTAKELRERFPDRKIIYRPKPRRGIESGVDYDEISNYPVPIEKVLSQVGLVVCRHSNVAVDACRLGVPAVCDDGAAAAIYPTLDNYLDQPDLALRTEFLHRLAWWQWSIRDMVGGQFWPWMLKQIADIR